MKAGLGKHWWGRDWLLLFADRFPPHRLAGIQKKVNAKEGRGRPKNGERDTERERERRKKKEHILKLDGGEGEGRDRTSLFLPTSRSKKKEGWRSELAPAGTKNNSRGPLAAEDGRTGETEKRMKRGRTIFFAFFDVFSDAEERPPLKKAARSLSHSGGQNLSQKKYLGSNMNKKKSD